MITLDTCIMIALSDLHMNCLSVPVLMHAIFNPCVHGSDDAMLLPTRLAQIMHRDGVS